MIFHGIHVIYCTIYVYTQVVFHIICLNTCADIDILASTFLQHACTFTLYKKNPMLQMKVGHQLITITCLSTFSGRRYNDEISIADTT